MKIDYTAILFLAGMFGQVHAQQIEEVCVGEEVIYTLGTPEYVSVQWQHSDDGINYNDIQNEIHDSLVIDSAADHQFYRARLTDSNCAAYYSDVHELIINPLPELHISGINDMYCANEAPRTFEHFSFRRNLKRPGHYGYCF